MDKIPALPSYRFVVKLLNALVKYFPRRLVPARFYQIPNKYTSHPTLLTRPITNLDRFTLPEGLHIEIASEQTIKVMAKHPEGLPLEVYQSRSKKNDFPICLYSGGELVSYNWLSFQRTGVFLGFQREIEFMQLDAKQAFTYDFYTYIKHRNMGYGKTVKSCIFQYLLEKQINEIMTCIHTDNDASLAVHIKQGYHLKAVVFSARILDWVISYFGNAKEYKRYEDWFEQYSQWLQGK